MLQPFSGPVNTTRIDRVVRNLERELAFDPSNLAAARELYTVLDYYVPANGDLGKYTKCQTDLAEKVVSPEQALQIVKNNRISNGYEQWEKIIFDNRLNTKVPISQIFRGNVHRINGVFTDCDMRLKFFKEEDAISKICFSCYKVQALVANVENLFKLHFIFRDLELPNNVARKCMVELREKVPVPYKGYIFCESEEQAHVCKELLEQALQDMDVSGVKCGISHGCSEYGLTYPKFKYSADGSHRQFETSKSWRSAEAEYRLKHSTGAIHREAMTTAFITLRDILAFHTWIAYARLIGDDTADMFGNAYNYEKADRFMTRVRLQSSLRKAEMDGLSRSLSAD